MGIVQAIKDRFSPMRNVKQSISEIETLDLRMRIARNIMRHGGEMDKQRARLRMKDYRQQMRALKGRKHD